MSGILNKKAVNDSRKVVTGSDAALLDDDGKVLATVETFQATMTANTATYQPLGDPQQRDVPVSYKVTLSFTELMVRDDKFIKDCFAYMNSNKHPEWNFQGLISGQDGSEQRYVYNYCVPSGAIDLQNISVGDVIKRNFNLTVNGKVKPQGYLKQ